MSESKPHDVSDESHRNSQSDAPKPRRRWPAFLLGLVLGMVGMYFLYAWWGGLTPFEVPAPPSAPAQRSAEWAEPLDRPGLPNLHKVANGLYRGAQPTAEGFAQLREMGVKTVLNLRKTNTDADLVGDETIEVIHSPIITLRVSQEDAREFLRIIRDREKYPLFYHCQHGADRTGLMTAIYRVEQEGWSVNQAAAEMTCGGFGYHRALQNLLKFLYSYSPQSASLSVEE
jgi:protein tyrosine phosphatase (PTP) superfamily phosphohydrolase (DUF442 family)